MKKIINKFFKGLVFGLLLRFALSSNKALAIDENPSNNTIVCIEDKRHIKNIDVLQVDEVVQSEKKEKALNLSESHEQKALEPNLPYVAIHSTPIEKLISESREYVAKDRKKLPPKLSAEQILREASRRNQCTDYLSSISQTNEVNEKSFQILKQTLNEINNDIMKKEVVILKLEKEIMLKEQTILKLQKELVLKNQIIIKLEEDLGVNPSARIGTAGSPDRFPGSPVRFPGDVRTEWIQKINSKNLGPIQRASLHDPSPDQDKYLRLHARNKASTGPLKGEAFTGPLHSKIHVRYDLEISTKPQTDKYKPSYETTTQVEVSPNLLRDPANPPTGE